MDDTKNLIDYIKAFESEIRQDDFKLIFNINLLIRYNIDVSKLAKFFEEAGINNNLWIEEYEEAYFGLVEFYTNEFTKDKEQIDHFHKIYNMSKLSKNPEYEFAVAIADEMFGKKYNDLWACQEEAIDRLYEAISLL